MSLATCEVGCPFAKRGNLPSSPTHHKITAPAIPPINKKTTALTDVSREMAGLAELEEIAGTEEGDEAGLVVAEALTGL